MHMFVKRAYCPQLMGLTMLWAIPVDHRNTRQTLEDYRCQNAPQHGNSDARMHRKMATTMP
jgi:hypothetical protein